MRNKRIFSLLSMRLLAAVAISALMGGQVALALACAQQPAAGKGEFPATPVGNLARSLIEAINSGEKTAQLSFINSSFSAAALKRNPAEEYLDQFQKLYRQSGGFDLMAVLPSSNTNEIRLQLRSKRGNYWVRMLTRLEQGEAGKLDGFG